MPETVILDKDAGIATITLNRPKARNAINRAMRHELAEAVRDAGDDDSVCAIVLRGSGDRAFCAGADITEFTEPSSLVVEREDRGRWKWTDAIADSEKPTIAAVHGYCLGGGLEIALACDLRIARSDAVFGLPEVRLAIIPGAGGTQRLPRVVGTAAALRMILTGERIDTSEAMRIGLVSQVTDDEEFEAAIQSLAETFRSCGPRALAYAKQAVRAATELPLRDGLRLEADLSTLLTTTRDRLEGAEAFRERRAPDYHGS